MTPRRHYPVLLFLFFGSGCAALVYEIVWFQLLQLAIGSSAVSLGVLLATYMGGLCLGSLALPKFVPAKRHPLRVYAALEAGTGVLAILVLFTVPLLDRLYATVASHGWRGIVPRAILAAICLVPPTLLMGASLPAIARWVEATAEGVSWLGYLYGGNLAGAVSGCLLAGFYLLRVYDMRAATLVAAAVNFGVAIASYELSRRTDRGAAAESRPVAPRGSAAVYDTIALSGMTALGAEVIWTRLLSVMMGATVYTFSIILAVFLIGLGIGSAPGSRLAGRSPKIALGVSQLLLAAAIFWSAYALSASIPYWPINPLLSSNAWFNFQIDLVRAMWAILPAAILWGASFPLALAAAASPGGDPGLLVGRIYAANTIGAIVGSLGFSLLFIPWLGSQNSQRLLIALAGIAAAGMLLPMIRSLKAAAAIAAAAAVTGVMIAKTDEVPWLAVAYGRRMLTASGTGDLLYRGEGMNASVVVSRVEGGQIYFHVSGKVEASTEPFDMRLQRMLGHLPALVHPNPESVLIVGFGAGVTAGTFVVHPEVRKITICEIEKLIPPTTSRYFRNENYDVLHDPRTRVFYDDARHYVLTTDETFDVITSDPIHPWVKGTATLYSKEYFEVCKRHLKPGGVVTQWVPLYESDPETIKTELATFFDVFPNGTIWANDVNGEGYDVVLLGQKDEARIDADQMERRLASAPAVADSLRQVGFSNAAELLGTYAGRATDLRPWLTGAHVNTDLDLRLQYLAGMGLNFNNANEIKQQIAAYLRSPRDLFTGSPETLRAIESGFRR